MKELLRALWLVSLLAFVISYLFTYSTLPEVISVGLKQSGVAFIRLGRETYFYLGIGILLITNIVLFSLAKLLDRMPVNTPDKFSFFHGKEDFKDNVMKWLYSLMAILNMFFIAVSVFIWAFNSNQVTDLFNFGFILYLWPVLMLIWLAMLVGMLVRQK